MEMNHILVVEDDKEIREGVKIYLQSQGYEVFLAADGIEGLEVMEKEDIHLAIVDIMMPRMDGIRMTMKLREKYDFPVIMLSAKSEEVDKIMGLNIGADDYVTKPFTPMELMARVNSQLRRYRRFMEKLEVRENVHVIGGLEINEDTVEVSIDGKPVKLTPIEYKILLLLAKNPGRVFSAEEIYERVWQEKAISHRSSTGQKLFGIGKNHIDEMTLKGAQSPVRLRKSDGIAFIIRVPDNLIDPMSVISVFRFKVKKKMRIAEYASVGTFGDRQRNTLERQPFTSRRFGSSSYLIILKGVETGEYGITVDALGSLNVSTFGVDE